MISITLRAGGFVRKTSDNSAMKTFALSYEEADQIDRRIGTPAYIYDEGIFREAAKQFLGMPNAFGLTVRFAMKACPNASVLRLFESMGLYFDASSGYEVSRLLHAGVGTTHISISTQELPADFADMVEQGVEVNACSLDQLKAFGERFPGAKVGVRFNPGLGSGGTNRTNVGGPGSSFGIWHELLPEVLEIAQAHQLEITRVHSHIGSGSDPAVWERAASLTLDLVRQIPTVTAVNLGGGFKVARVEGEKTTDLQVIGQRVKALFEDFAGEDGRELALEVEPEPCWWRARACCLPVFRTSSARGPKGIHSIS
jgi:diaminopimelate decarboxylase